MMKKNIIMDVDFLWNIKFGIYIFGTFYSISIKEMKK